MKIELVNTQEENCSLQPLVATKYHVYFIYPLSVLDWRWIKGKRQMDNYFNVLNAFIDKKDSYYSIHQIGKKKEMLRCSKWAKEGSHLDTNFPEKSEKQPDPVFPELRS